MQYAQHATAVCEARIGPRGVRSKSVADAPPSVSSGKIWRWLLLLAAVLTGGAVVAFNFDCSVAQWFKLRHGPGYFHDLATISELFGRGECVLLVAILIWRLDRARLWAVPGLAATALLSGLSADGVKMVIARVRPHHFDFLGGVWSSFGPWLPLASLGSPNQSFPSAHTATAMGLAISLMVVYPAARGLFCFAPLLVAYQRIDSGAHFLSDVLCGAAAGCIIAAVTVRLRWLDREYSLHFWGRAGAIIGRLRGSEVGNPKLETLNANQITSRNG
jgi:membrane-associated phospholipid phosphatase